MPKIYHIVSGKRYVNAESDADIFHVHKFTLKSLIENVFNQFETDTYNNTFSRKAVNIDGMQPFIYVWNDLKYKFIYRGIHKIEFYQRGSTPLSEHITVKELPLSIVFIHKHNLRNISSFWRL